MNTTLILALFFGVAQSLSAATIPQSSAQTPFRELYGEVKSAAVDHKSTVQIAFLDSFFSLLPTLRENRMTLNRWFREDHVIYLLDFLNEGELTRMTPIFGAIQMRIENGDTDMRQVLVGVGPAGLIAKVGKVDLEIQRLKEMHKDVIQFAVTKHEYENNQRYGNLPYSYHLRQVRGVLKRFGFGPKDSVFGLKLGTAAWLHDVIEDTDATYENIVELFGQEIADIVRGVTKIKSADGSSLRVTYERTRENQGSRILKLADRIANVEEGLIDLFAGKKSKVQKYFNEFSFFKEMLFVPGDADEMWKHLESLLTNLDYAQRFAVSNLYKLSVPDCAAKL